MHHALPRRSMPGKLAEEAEVVLDRLDANHYTPVGQTRREHPRYSYRHNVKLEHSQAPHLRRAEPDSLSISSSVSKRWRPRSCASVGPRKNSVSLDRNSHLAARGPQFGCLTVLGPGSTAGSAEGRSPAWVWLRSRRGRRRTPGHRSEDRSEAPGFATSGSASAPCRAWS